MRPSQSKIDAVAELAKVGTVEEVTALLGRAGYLRKFVPRYSALASPVDLGSTPRQEIFVKTGANDEGTVGRGTRSAAGGDGSGFDIAPDLGHAGPEHPTSAAHGPQLARSRTCFYPSNRQLGACGSIHEAQVVSQVVANRREGTKHENQTLWRCRGK